MNGMEQTFFYMCIAKDKRRTIRSIIKELTSMGYYECDLWFYLGKWAGKGFYRYGAIIDLGELLPEKLTGQYREIYRDLTERRRHG